MKLLRSPQPAQPERLRPRSAGPRFAGPRSTGPRSAPRPYRTLRRAVSAGIMTALVVLLGGCISLGGIYSSSESGGSGGSSGSSGSSGADSAEQNGIEPDNGDAGESGEGRDARDAGDAGADEPVVSGTQPGRTDEPFFRVTEDYWVQTPWFGVSSIIVMVRRTLPPTRIVVPSGTLLANVMRPVDNVVAILPTDHRRDRIRININFHMGDVPPFVAPKRYANPEDYW